MGEDAVGASIVVVLDHLGDGLDIDGSLLEFLEEEDGCVVVARFGVLIDFNTLLLIFLGEFIESLNCGFEVLGVSEDLKKFLALSFIQHQI